MAKESFIWSFLDPQRLFLGGGLGVVERADRHPNIGVSPLALLKESGLVNPNALKYFNHRFSAGRLTRDTAASERLRSFCFGDQ